MIWLCKQLLSQIHQEVHHSLHTARKVHKALEVDYLLVLNIKKSNIREDPEML